MSQCCENFIHTPRSNKRERKWLRRLVFTHFLLRFIWSLICGYEIFLNNASFICCLNVFYGFSDVYTYNILYDEVMHCSVFQFPLILETFRRTKCIIFRTPNTKVVKADVLLNGEPVDPVDSTVFLDVTITVEASYWWIVE